MSIAEKILQENGGWKSPSILTAMRSYADFYYWLGKEGWVRVGKDWGKSTSNLPVVWISESILYSQYIAEAERDITRGLVDL